MPRGRRIRREPWLLEVLTWSYHYRGFEVTASIDETGALHVVVYSDDLSELVWRGDNICYALNWIDNQTKDQQWD